MSALKCPNPSCPFLFDPTQVPPGALLTCPRCGMRFTLGPTAAPGYPPPNVGYQPPVVAPTGGYGPSETASIPNAEPVDDDTAASAPSQEGSGVSAGKAPPRKRGGAGALIAAVGGALLLLGVIVFGVVLAIMLKSNMSSGDGVTSSDLAKPEWNFAYKMPGDPWVMDADMKNEISVNAFAMKRGGPDAWAALSVSDYKDRSPLLHELREKMLDQLNRVFQNLPPDLTLEPVKWAGKDAYHCRFRGERRVGETTCIGDCYVLSYKGLGYWFYAWSAEADFDKVGTELAELKDKFRTLNEREKWSEKVGNKVTFPRKGTHKLKYQIATFEKFWKEDERSLPTDLRPKADLVLRGEFTGRSKQDRPPYAELAVLFIEGGGDPMSVAAKEVRAYYTRDPDTFGKFNLTELTGEPLGEPPPGEEPAAVQPARYKVSPADPNASKSAEKLVVYAAIEVDGQTVIAEASCPWSQREVWERRLIQFVGTLKGK